MSLNDDVEALLGEYGSTELSAMQERAIELIMLCRMPSEVCRTLDIPITTLRAWQGNERFRAALDARLAELRMVVNDVWRAAQQRSLETLIEHLEGGDAKLANRTAMYFLDRFSLVDGAERQNTTVANQIVIQMGTPQGEALEAEARKRLKE